MSSPDLIERFRAGLESDVRETIDSLRALISASDERLVEDFKWNAPSFAVNGEHRITLGLERGGQVRAVLHRGAKAKDTSDFYFDDPDRIARWPDPDRGVIIVRDAEEVASKGASLTQLFSRWIAATI